MAEHPAVKIGDPVLYVPDFCHHLNLDASGEPVWHFRHEGSGVYGHPGKQTHYRPGDQVKTFEHLGKIAGRTGEGKLLTFGGHVIGPHRVKRPWKATVRAVTADGRVSLDVQHPNEMQTLHYPDLDAHPGAPGLPYDPTGQLCHSWHLPGDRTIFEGS